MEGEMNSSETQMLDLVILTPAYKMLLGDFIDSKKVFWAWAGVLETHP